MSALRFSPGFHAFVSARVVSARVYRAGAFRAGQFQRALSNVGAASGALLAIAGAVRTALVVLWMSTAIAGSACSPSHFDGRVFRKGDVAFRLQRLPEEWRPIEISDTALAFRDDENAATVAINGRCGKDAEDVPLQSLTQHLFLQFTDRQLEDQELFPLDGREALRTEMTAKLDGVQKYFHVVVLKKDGCVYDFLQIANQHQEKDPFLDFVRGFQSLG